MSPAASIPSWLTFWGKAQSQEHPGDVWHPIAYHCLDVAACVERILTVRPLALGQAVRLFRAEPAPTVSLLTALAALHDIGKFADCFQAKRPELWPAALGPIPLNVAPTYHTRDGFCLWSGPLRTRIAADLWSGDPFALTLLVQAVMGHHGRPVSFNRQRDFISTIFRPAGREAAEEFATTVTRLLVTEPLVAAPFTESDALRATWWIAGLITTADWIGSNESRFPYVSPMSDDDSLETYWEIAKKQAVIAVARAGLEPPTASGVRSFAELTGRTEPRTPAQNWAAKVDIPDGPTLFILEDVTGAGKTEAAQILVNRLMAAGRAAGAFWAMPTQATANAMYERQRQSIRALFDENSIHRPSLVLAHGQSRMHNGFRGTIIVDEPNALASSTQVDAPDAPSEITCAAFIAKSSRAALMADIGAGTVDQAILSILPSRFNTMRLFGLAEKVLILDEIHAYDSYMTTELRALLRFHAALGGSVIALSATLSSKLTMALVQEWRLAVGGCSDAVEEFSCAVDYPLATLVGTGGAHQQEISPTPWSRRALPVRLVHDQAAVIEQLFCASRQGAASVWIRNTVDSCREAAAILRARGATDVIQFHARFAQVDRQRREADVLARFGPTDGGARAGCILVATQVVEQSLDLDFDVMVSDLAPIDLLMQRAGRLWRHAWRSRESFVSSPELIVLSPPFQEDPEVTWLDDLLPKTKWVYRDAGVLWRTLRALRQQDYVIDVPDGVRGLIEQVYNDDFCPANLESSADRALGDDSAAVATASQYALKIDDGYIGEGILWASDVRVPTRLNEHQTSLRLGRVTANKSIVPWADDPDLDVPPWQRWALSEVRVSKHRIPVGMEPEPELRASCDAVRSTWGQWEQEMPLVPLRPEGTRWIGSVSGTKGRQLDVSYDPESGFSIG